jgi:hypothetical protein
MIAQVVERSQTFLISYNINTMLSSITDTDLKTLAKRFKIKLRGIVSKDQLRRIKPESGSYIINLQDSDAGYGTHWVCLFIQGKKSMYYDSFGKVMPNDILAFCIRNHNKNIVYNADQIQDLNSQACGYYCLAVLHYFTTHPKVSDFGYAINIFNKPFDVLHTPENEDILVNYFKKHSLELDVVLRTQLVK